MDYTVEHATGAAAANDSKLIRCARFPRMRALAWSNDILYVSRGYQLFKASLGNPSLVLRWQPIATFHPTWNRRLSVTTNLSARLFRDGFHALAVLPSGTLVAAVPGAIVTLPAGETEFLLTHAITRGTRPLHLTAIPSGTVFWGEYFDNPRRDAVYIYASQDGGQTWDVAYGFSKNSIRHVHNILHDPWGNCLWIFTGDYGDECRILRATCDFTSIEIIMQGQQQARAVAAIPAEDGIYFSTDTPLEKNFIYHLDRRGHLSQLASISSSSIYGCRVGRRVYFSTMVEPSEVNRDRAVRLYSGENRNPHSWNSVFAWQKDPWPMGLFQYGNAFLPDGNNTSGYLAVTTAAVKSDDQALSLFVVNP